MFNYIQAKKKVRLLCTIIHMGYATAKHAKIVPRFQNQIPLLLIHLNMTNAMGLLADT